MKIIKFSKFDVLAKFESFTSRITVENTTKIFLNEFKENWKENSLKSNIMNKHMKIMKYVLRNNKY